jgi:hypothetical protein
MLHDLAHLRRFLGAGLGLACRWRRTKLVCHRRRWQNQIIPVTVIVRTDDTFLAADTRRNLLVNVAVHSAGVQGKNVQFQVIDLGNGRVALKAANGRFVSVAESGVTLEDPAGKAPDEAESFQWINLMRGDTALMSLVNHRYLTTRPNEPGQATAAATGPSPARKNGVCFKWKAIE